MEDERVEEKRGEAAVDPLIQRRLILAVSRSDAAEAKAALGLGADANMERPGGASGSYLTHAIFDGNEDLARALLEAGADPNAMDDSGRPALLQALQRADAVGERLAVELYVFGANPHKRSIWCHNIPIEYACERSRLHALKGIIRAGYDPRSVGASNRSETLTVWRMGLQEGWEAVREATLSGLAEREGDAIAKGLSAGVQAKSRRPRV